MLKYLLIVSVLLYSFPCFAQMSDEELNKSVAEINKNLLKSTNELSKSLTDSINQLLDVLNQGTNQFNQTAPQVTHTLVKTISDMSYVLNSYAVASEKNSELPPATPEIYVELKNALPAKYTQDTDFNINKQSNEITLKGTYKEDNTTLKYTITRNLAATYMFNKILNKDLSEKSALSIVDNNNNPIALSNFKTETIDGKDFLTAKDEKQKTAAYVGNIGAYVNVNILSSGEEYSKVAEEFIKSLDYSAIQSAVKDDGKNLKDISAEIEKEASNLNIFNTETTAKGK